MPALSVNLGDMEGEAERKRCCLEWMDATEGLGGVRGLSGGGWRGQGQEPSERHAEEEKVAGQLACSLPSWPVF